VSEVPQLHCFARVPFWTWGRSRRSARAILQ